MDRNSITGFILLVLLGAGYIYYSNYQQQQYYEQKTADSLAAAARTQVTPDSSAFLHAALSDSTLAKDDDSNGATISVNTAFSGKQSYVTLDNDLLALRFSTKGGYPVQAELKKYNNYHKGVVSYFNSDKNNLEIEIPYQGKNISTADLYFTSDISTVNNGDKRLTLSADLGNGKQVVYYYILPKEDYMITAGIQLNGFGNDLSGVRSLPMSWTTEALMTEKDMGSERFYMQNHFQYTNGDADYERLKGGKDKKLKKPVKWFTVRSHFFNSTLIADKEFTEGSFSAIDDDKDDSVVIATNTTKFSLPINNSGSNYEFGFRWLISPNDYHLVKSYNIGLEEIISLGYGPFFFVKYISKWFIIPLFDFLTKTVGSIGISIILLILVIRLLLSFFSYKSYLSSAKTRALKPELEELKKKFGSNQQQMGMEQMKLYRTAGVNPLGGCLPMLLQMPFLLAVYYFIPTSLDLRQVSFLWSEDLSAYDSIMTLPFNIPIYGDHVSLFTLLMAATSLFLALYNQNNMTAAPTGGSGAGPDMQKMMKYMPYFMPFMFLGWFNGMAAGLTLYYTFSNLISMGQQFAIQKFFINEESIRSKIKERQSQPAKATTSKWQQRLEEMQKMQQDKMKGKK